MREILITILILGCFSTFASAERGLFEFFDSYGRCWRCLPGRSCVRCTSITNLVASSLIGNWSRDCPLPDESICIDYLGVQFPSTDMRFYYICSDDGLVIAPCPCDKVFEFSSQNCLYSDNITSSSCYPPVYQCTDSWKCGTPTPLPYDCPGATPPTVDSITTTTTTPIWVSTAPNETPTTTTTTTKPIWVPTAPNETPTTTTTTTPPIWVPTAPNETPTTTTTTTPPIWVSTAPNETPTITTTTKTVIWVSTAPNETPTTTRTTEIGGPGVTNPGNTTTIPSNTTPAPCVCVVWWPCWCNPCWNMPCHSCNGCVGMMG